jgi:hypothetical protein
MTKVSQCRPQCKHNYQDEKYGEGMRVFNKTKSDPPKWRCTVCGDERGGGEDKGKK